MSTDPDLTIRTSHQNADHVCDRMGCPRVASSRASRAR
jgi:hypothetical protein